MSLPKKLDIPQNVLDDKGGVLTKLPKELTKERQKELLWHMIMVRCIDQRMLKLQRSGRIGFVGSMLGMEAAMIGSGAALKSQDWLWSGLREGGAALMRGLPLSEYIAQMYCNSNDTAKGRQMNNHFQHKGSNYPSWSSVIGTQIPHGVGAAWADKRAGNDNVHGIYFGDGATSANGFHSGMNLAAVWQVPAVFVCVNNGWAISVPSCNQTAAESYADKAVGYGMQGYEVDGMDVLATYMAMKDLVENARKGKGPSLLVVNTYRLMGHSSSDDPSKYRDADEVAYWEAKDPLKRYSEYLQAQGIIKEGELAQMEEEIFAQIDAEVNVQEAAPPMPLKSLVEDVYAGVPYHLKQQYNDFIRIAEKMGDAQPGDGAFPL